MKRELALMTGRRHDLVVIGGGICGAAAAWDAAQRGLAVALVEADDFGAGTSWNSLKTIHGGLRHLQRADLASLRESVRERRALLRIAPALVKPLAFLVPSYGHGLRGREALGLGLRLADVLSADRNRELAPDQQLPRGRILTRRQALDLVPGLLQEGLNGGAVWTDAQVLSSERLVMGFVQAAAAAGAAAANHIEASGLLRAGARVIGIRARDAIDGRVLEIRADAVLNAAGPGMDGILALAGIVRPRVPLLRAINLVLKRPIVATHAVGARIDGRFLFVVPWQGRSILGTAYAPPDQPLADQTTAFLAAAARAYPWAELQPDDVALVHRGLVPGTDGGSGLWTRSQLVDHEADGAPGLVSALAVKYTTARALAEKAVDLVLRRLGRASVPSRTATTPLPEARLLEGTIEERTRHAVRVEMALTLADAVLRRTDLGSAGPPAEDVATTVLSTMAAELSWDAARQAAERRSLLAAYRA